MKIIYHGDEVTDFYDKDTPKVDSNHFCLGGISLDFTLKKDEIYYAHVFSKECKYIEKKLIRHVHDSLNYSFSDDSNDSDEE